MVAGLGEGGTGAIDFWQFALSVVIEKCHEKSAATFVVAAQLRLLARRIVARSWFAYIFQLKSIVLGHLWPEGGGGIV